MREIRFRAWDRESKRICNVEQIEFNQKYAWVSWHKTFTQHGYFKLNFNKIELMQFTGLFDKNNKEIYEGDICIGLMDGGLDYTHIKFVVEFKDGAFVDSYFHRKLLSEKQNIEIIGNIYETLNY